MPTPLTHTAPMLALYAGFGGKFISSRLAVAGIICSVLPDLDMVGYILGVKYASFMGHRGFSHSLLFAFIVGCAGMLCARCLHTGRLRAFLVAFFAVASHIVLDAATNGGLGVAAFWPWDESRFFFSKRPIAVCPFNPMLLLGSRGLRVMSSELLWVWLPCLGGVLFLWSVRLGLREKGKTACRFPLKKD